MKKATSIILIAVMLFMFASCGNKADIIDKVKKDKETTSESLENVFSIREQTFVATVDSIYRDTEYYQNSYDFIKYVGFVLNQADPNNKDVSYNWVCRYGPGCCGSGTTPGFLVVYDGELPKEKTWVEVTGKIKTAAKGDPIYDYLYDLLGTLYTEDEKAITEYAYFEIDRILDSKPGLETVGIT